MNQINLIGRTTKPPELRHTQSGTSVTSFTLAVDRPRSKDREKETDFIDCVAWRNTAEFIAKYFAKGQQMAITGRLQIRDYTDKEGNKRKAAEVVVDNAYFCGDKKTQDYGCNAPVFEAPVTGQDFAELDDEETLPF